MSLAMANNDALLTALEKFVAAVNRHNKLKLSVDEQDEIVEQTYLAVEDNIEALVSEIIRKRSKGKGKLLVKQTVSVCGDCGDRLVGNGVCPSCNMLSEADIY